MTSSASALAFVASRFPEYPEAPNLEGVGNEILLFVGRRSDQQERSHHPTSVFEMELDAEVQDLYRQHQNLVTEVEQYLEHHRRAAAARNNMAIAIVVSAVVVCLFAIWMSFAKSHSSTEHSSANPATSPTPPMKVAPASSPLPAASSATEAPQGAASGPSPSASSAAVVPGSVLGRPAPSLPPSLAGATEAGTRTTVNGRTPPEKGEDKDARIFALEEQTPAKSEPPAAEKPSSEKPGPTTKHTVDPIVVKSPPVAKVTAKASRAEDPSPKNPKARSEPTESQPEPPADSPKPGSDDTATRVRKDRYGSSGVVTLMPTGVVVFDVNTKSQKLVPIGSKLPDGSVLRGVDPKSSRIKTDKGEVEFE